MIKTIRANYVDVVKRTITTADITFGKIILNISTVSDISTEGLPYCVPGLVDSHVHIESSMLTPQRFATMVIPHGTVGVVCDPHEIANVLGETGVRYMMNDAEKSPLHFFFAIPSCVPATPFETNGADFGPRQISRLMPKAVALAEMMNFPGVLANDHKIVSELQIARKAFKPVDGHIPGITDERLAKYVAAGISTDHESYELSEAQAKIKLGMKILIREGSAARNLEALMPLFKTNVADIMACTDDAHPDDIRDRGHIDKFYRRARRYGVDVFDIFRVLNLNPAKHYKLPVGAVQVGDAADFVLIGNLDDYDVQEVYLSGEQVYANGGLTFAPSRSGRINKFVSRSFSCDDFRVLSPTDNPRLRVIKLIKDQLVTGCFEWSPGSVAKGGVVPPSVEDDIMKIAVVNRYDASAPVVNGFIMGTGLQGGAMASSIAHDSHNVVVIGHDEESMRAAAEAVFKSKGGISVVSPNGKVLKLALPVAGLMAPRDWRLVAERYERLIGVARRDCRVSLTSPFMTMAFMSLLVIPKLKIGDKGLFDVDKFGFVDLFI